MTRPDYYHIAKQVDANSRVLDLACEDGQLLNYIRQRQGIDGIGVDMNNTQLTHCLASGLQVIHTDIRQGLSLFASNSFDYVILSQTLQSINQPLQVIIEEMLRVGRVAIVSFPNFAYWHFRLQLLLGRMPVGGRLPYEWDNTPHVRFCTINDFDQWCKKQGLTTQRRICLSPAGKPLAYAQNALAETAIYTLSR